MNRTDLDVQDLQDAIERLRTPKRSYHGDEELLDAGQFVADFGHFGDLFEGEDLTRAQYWAHDPAAAWGILAHWSVQRGDPEFEPIDSFESHISVCPPCMYLEEVKDLRDGYQYENCEECGLDLDQHDIGPDPIGKAHAWCRNIWTRQEPAVSPAGQHAENQVSDAFDARWWARLSDGNYALVSRTFYVCIELDDGELDPDGEEYMVQEDEFLVCTDPNDPGSTELNADYVYTEIDNPESMDPAEMARTATEPEPGEWQERAPKPYEGLLISGAPLAAV